MAKVNINYETRVNNSLGLGIILIWKGLGENNPNRYEMYKRTSVIFNRYKNGEVGIKKGTLDNYFSKNKSDEPIIFENDKVRIIRTKLLTVKDFPPEKKEK